MARYDEDDDDDLDIRRDRGRDREPIPNYLVQSILTIFCCWAFAIVAIINAAKVNGLVAEGRYEEAMKASQEAKKWATIAFIVGLCTNGLYIIFTIMTAGQGGGFPR